MSGGALPREPAADAQPAPRADGGQPELRAVCVFCGSAPGARPEYVQAARAFGALLARSGLVTVYGGGQVGMMGAVADGALAEGGQVVGVIPTHLMKPEVAHARLTELRVVDSMHTRKRTMAELSDAFVVLPGGYGTFEEMFEMVTWLQLRLHDKPVGVLNVEGYFDRLLGFLRHASAEGYIRAGHGDLLIVEAAPELLLQRLRLHRPGIVRQAPGEAGGLSRS